MIYWSPTVVEGRSHEFGVFIKLSKQSVDFSRFRLTRISSFFCVIVPFLSSDAGVCRILFLLQQTVRLEACRLNFLLFTYKIFIETELFLFIQLFYLAQWNKVQ